MSWPPIQSLWLHPLSVVLSGFQVIWSRLVRVGWWAGRCGMRPAASWSICLSSLSIMPSPTMQPLPIRNKSRWSILPAIGHQLSAEWPLTHNPPNDPDPNDPPPHNQGKQVCTLVCFLHISDNALVWALDYHPTNLLQHPNFKLVILSSLAGKYWF